MEPLNKDPFLKDNKIESVATPKEVVDAAPDRFPQKTVVQAAQRPIVPGFQNTGVGVAPVQSLNSANFTSNTSGWALGSNGDAQFNGNRVVTTHFVPAIKLYGVTVYISDGTSPNGTLSGATGDIVLHGDSGKIYYCVGTTTWVAPS